MNGGICSLGGPAFWSVAMLVMVNGGICSLGGPAFWLVVMLVIVDGGMCSLRGLGLLSVAMFDMVNIQQEMYKEQSSSNYEKGDFYCVKIIEP